MGSFDIACGLSGFGISPGDNVKLMLITDQGTSYYRLSFLLDAKYDDFGNFIIPSSDMKEIWNELLLDITGNKEECLEDYFRSIHRSFQSPVALYVCRQDVFIALEAQMTYAYRTIKALDKWYNTRESALQGSEKSLFALHAGIGASAIFGQDGDRLVESLRLAADKLPKETVYKLVNELETLDHIRHMMRRDYSPMSTIGDQSTEWSQVEKTCKTLLAVAAKNNKIQKRNRK